MCAPVMLTSKAVVRTRTPLNLTQNLFERKVDRILNAEEVSVVATITENKMYSIQQ